jgi:hypothetical protein
LSPGGVKINLFCTSSKAVLRSTQPPTQRVLGRVGELSAGVEWPVCEPDHLQLVQKSRICVSVHLLFSHLHGKELNSLCTGQFLPLFTSTVQGGIGFTKKTTSRRVENMYLFYIFSPKLHTLMTSVF